MEQWGDTCQNGLCITWKQYNSEVTILTLLNFFVVSLAEKKLIFIFFLFYLNSLLRPFFFLTINLINWIQKPFFYRLLITFFLHFYCDLSR